jgi:hypothetical protein
MLSGAAPLRLERAPQGVGASAQAAPTRAYAGRFRTLVAGSTTAESGMTATTRYTFRASTIDARWALRALPAGHRAQVLFPTWGRRGVVVTAHLTAGGERRIGRAPVALSRIAWIEVAGPTGGYRVTPLHRPAGAVVRLVATCPQSSAPTPGPTVAVEIRRAAGRGVAFGARLRVAAAA